MSAQDKLKSSKEFIKKDACTCSLLGGRAVAMLIETSWHQLVHCACHVRVRAQFYLYLWTFYLSNQ
jgi:hypothetical protein